MVTAKNIINKLSFDIAYPDKAESAGRMKILDETSDFFHAKVLPAIESYLAKKSEGKNIFIETLELDLGDVTEENFHEILLDELDKCLPRSIINESKEQDNTSRSNIHPGSSFNDQLNGNNQLMYMADGELTGEYEEKAFLYFIANGIFPWYFQNQDTDPDQLFDKVFTTGSPHFFNDFLNLLKGSKLAIERFILQFDQRHVDNVFKRLINELEPQCRLILKNWEEVVLRSIPGDNKQNNIVLYRFILTENNDKKDQENFITSFSCQVVARTDMRYVNKLLAFILKQDRKQQELFLKGWYQFILENRSAVNTPEYVALLQFILSGDANASKEFTFSFVAYLINQTDTKQVYKLFQASFNELREQNKTILNAWIYFISRKDAAKATRSYIALAGFMLHKKHTEPDSAGFIRAFAKDILATYFSVDQQSLRVLIDYLKALSTNKTGTAKKTTITTEKIYRDFFEKIQKRSESGKTISGQEKPINASGKNSDQMQQQPGENSFFEEDPESSGNHKNDIMPEPKEISESPSDKSQKKKIKPDTNDLPGIARDKRAAQNIQPYGNDVSPEGAGSFDDTEALDSFIINNSGMVLLFPYLSMFFKDMGFIKDGAFPVKEMQYKAAQILHYLATNSRKTPEHLLVLNKLLVGLEINAPVPGHLRLSKKQKALCSMLLESVVAHWSALGSTSVRGLQGSFILRDGVLKKDGDNWLLHVEQKGYDILLDKIPWSFRLIKFSWNKYFIHVQW